MRPHWENSIAHFDEQVDIFVGEYFSDASRRCLFVAAAGFDPRSRHVAQLHKLGTRATAKRSARMCTTW